MNKTAVVYQCGFGGCRAPEAPIPVLFPSDPSINHARVLRRKRKKGIGSFSLINHLLH